VADRILQSVAIERELIEGAAQQSELHRAIAKFARSALYRKPEATLDRARKDIVRVVRKYLAEADRVGIRSAQPVLDGLGITERGSVLRGPVLDDFRRYKRRNLRAFAAQLRKETGGLSGDIEARFLEAARDGQARKGLVDQLVAADKKAVAELDAAYKAQAQAAEELKNAERAAARAGKRSQSKAKRRVREARKAVRKARAKVSGARSFLANFEKAVQRDAVDVVRREAQNAQFSAYRQAGFREFSWVAVNGTDACPDCSRLHGTKKKASEWKGRGPGQGQTVCGASCMCCLVPLEYTIGNESLARPLRAV